MLKLPHRLAEVNSKVFETTEKKRVWSLDNPVTGTEADAGQGRLDELTCSCYVVIPDMKKKRGKRSLLTISRGRAGDGAARMPSFWDPVELGEVNGGVYAHVTYDPSRHEIELGMNAGGESPELLGVTLEGATPELVCGRVLELYFEISEDRIYFAVHDRFADGDFVLSGMAPSTGRPQHPWGAPAAGNWWVTSGIDGRSGHALSLPPGFGFSNLRITLGADNEEAMGSLLYDGALDHLVAGAPERPVKEEVELLKGHVASLRATATDVERIRLLLASAEPAAARVEEDFDVFGGQLVAPSTCLN